VAAALALALALSTASAFVPPLVALSRSVTVAAAKLASSASPTSEWSSSSRIGSPAVSSIIGLPDAGLVVEALPWSEMEDWLVQDAFERFSIGDGRYVMWRRLVMEVPELLGRSPEDARARWLELTGKREMEEQPFYEQPMVLERWEDLGTGSFSGCVVGHPGVADGTLLQTAPVDLDGRHLSEMYIKTRGGVVYELGSSLLSDGSIALVGGEILRGAAQGAASVMPLALGTAATIASVMTIGAILTHHLQIEVFIV
jgi:hypothetical protein